MKPSLTQQQKTRNKKIEVHLHFLIYFHKIDIISLFYLQAKKAFISSNDRTISQKDEHFNFKFSNNINGTQFEFSVEPS